MEKSTEKPKILPPELIFEFIKFYTTYEIIRFLNDKEQLIFPLFFGTFSNSGKIVRLGAGYSNKCFYHLLAAKLRKDKLYSEYIKYKVWYFYI